MRTIEKSRESIRSDERFLARECDYWHILFSPQMGDGSRTRRSKPESAVSGSRARMLESTPAKSFFEKESAGIGLAKVEATARRVKEVVSDRLMNRGYDHAADRKPRG